MRNKTALYRHGAALVALALTASVTPAAQAQRVGQLAGTAELPEGSVRPTRQVLLSVGEGELINLPAAVRDVWISNPGIADVYVKSARQLTLYGKEFGEATVFATSAGGQIVYSARIRVSQNITSVDQMIKLAMPDADIKVTTVGQIAVMTGTVASPEDSATAERLVTTMLNPGMAMGPGAVLKIGIINRLKTATPLQVNLQVRFAEVSRSLVREINSNLQTRDVSSGMVFGLSRGSSPGTFANTGNTISGIPTTGLPVVDASGTFGLPANSVRLPFDPVTGKYVVNGMSYVFNPNNAGQSLVNLAGKLFGMDMMAGFDLGERVGLVTTLSQPNLTALSGETADFLAGGEYPIPISQGLGATSIDYKRYGVSLAYTPTVLANGRISLRVRPEVSELSSQGAVQLNGFQIPALTIRRAETTVELGSGQSFMIAGLLSNNAQNTIEKTPGAGDLPILGSLFRSTSYRRGETELVIVVTPYLVNPVNAADIKLPTDGYKVPNELQRILGNMDSDGKSGESRPAPTSDSDKAPDPGLGLLEPAAPARADNSGRKDRGNRRQSGGDRQAAAIPTTPGFDLD